MSDTCLFEAQGTRLVCRYDAELLWIEPWGVNSLRVRATKMAEMPEADWALLPPADCPAEISLQPDGSASIRNGSIVADVTPLGAISFRNVDGKTLLREDVRTRRIDLREENFSALEIETREFRPLLGGKYHLFVRFEPGTPDERLFGMGQYQQPQFDLKGTDLELAHRNSQASVPFVLSSLGYGFLWNNPSIGRATFATNRTTWEASSTGIMDYWITAGETPAAIVEQYAAVTGTVPRMPEYGLGFWQCKLRYRTQEEVLEAARTHVRKGIPLSVIVVDFFHWPLQGDWKFDPDYWPDPDAMVAELRSLGVELMVSVWPTVDTRSENYTEMKRRGYLIRTERGLRISMDFMGNTIHFDATNPDARRFVWDAVRRNYFEKGVRAYWLDEAEPEYSVYDFDNYRYHLGPNVEIGNIYPLLYTKTFFDGLTEAGQSEVVSLVRCAWAGSQRYGALVWSGDIHSDFQTLHNQYVIGLHMGLAGIPWWTSDIGGFQGAFNDDPAFHELLIRWFQFGTFCPVMRLHGCREPAKPQLGTTGGASCLSRADNEVWAYGPEVEKILVSYVRMRERMKPYVASLMEEAHEKGTPVMRPLFYGFPNDPEAWKDHEEYLFGGDVLVAPVMRAGMASRAVYLPKGATWTDAWTGERFSGGRNVEVRTPIERIPLFLRDGADLPIADPS